MRYPRSAPSSALILIATLCSGAHAAADTRSAEAAAPQPQPQIERLAFGPTPSPSLSPEDVVRVQMRALQQNGPQDRGIRTTYEFASPENKQATGPYKRFAQMVKSAPYRAMLNATTLTFGDILIHETQAAQEVRVVTASGQEVTYLFVVRRQSDPPYEDCWMTDAVFTTPRVKDDDHKRGPPGFG